MQLLKQQYIDHRIQQHLETLKIPQTRQKLTREALLDALRGKGALQAEEAAEEQNVFRWPFSANKDGPFYLKHSDIRFFYTYSGKKWEKRDTYFSVGMFATFRCAKEKPELLADEIIHLDADLIPLYESDFDNLSPEEMAVLATDEFREQCSPLREKYIILDTAAAHIFGVSVTEVRQTISRNKTLFEGEAFHLTFDEFKRRYRHYVNPPKLRRSDYMPYALTDRAFCLLAMGLRSPIAIKMHLGIIQAVSAHIPFAEFFKQFKESMKS